MLKMKWVIFVVCLSFGLFSSSAMARNELAGNASPYLAMHGNDPVNWHTWGAEALEKARQEDKLLFVSVGYFACHWCHVMQRESYSDRHIAKILNQGFVSIKVDRELNPVLDDRLIEFVQSTAGRAGWPLNVFLTPEGDPLVGMTYVPPDRFSKLLTDLQKRWKSERSELETAAKNVDEVIAIARAQADVAVQGESIARFEDKIVANALAIGDELQGGFGQSMKFPSGPQLWALLEWNQKHRRPELSEFLQLTLDQMASKGLFDHVGGGFFRYTVDPGWTTPHYEKMLYTNAMLARLYLSAAEQFHQPRYRQVALRTLHFMLREMKTRGNAFIASLSAVDHRGVEGGYYLWNQDDLKQYFKGDDLVFVNGLWDMLREPAPEAGRLPLRNTSREEIKETFDLDDAALDKKLANIRSTLQQARRKTRQVPRDDKRLAGWNGLALAALAAGSPLDTEVASAGQKLVSFIRSGLWDGSTLSRAVDSHNRSLGAGTLYDYAAVAFGLTEWAEKNKDPASIKLANQMVHQAWKRFYTTRGWRESETSLLPHPIYHSHLRDSALPSSEGLLIRATARVLAHQPDPKLQRQLDQLMTLNSTAVEEDPFYYAGVISAVAAVTGK